MTPIYTATPMTGGGQRTLHLYRALARLGDVDVALVSERVCMAMERDLASLRAGFPAAGHVFVQRSTEQFLMAPSATAPWLARVRYLAARVWHALRPRAHFFTPSTEARTRLADMIERRGYDVIVGRYLQATALSGAIEQQVIPVIVDLDDLDDALLLTRMRSPTTPPLRRAMLWWQALQVVPLSKRLRDRCLHVFTATETDRSAVAHRSSSVLPNIPYRRAEAPLAPASPATGNSVLFVGTFAHRANREGMGHFLKLVWPRILERTATAKLRIVGSGGWEERRENLETVDGVEVVGAVEDLATEYAAAALCIAPVYEGSGTKIKILEALMYGRVVVATEHSARGLAVLLDSGVVAAASDDEMVERVVALLGDPARCATLSQSGRRLVSELYSQDSVSVVVEDALRPLRAVPRRIPTAAPT